MDVNDEKDYELRSTTQQIITDPEVEQAAKEKEEAYLTSRGYTPKEGGGWNPPKTIGDLIPMRKSVEETERLNRKKALNSGLYQTISTLSDMFSAGLGGNVYNRPKDNTPEGAAKDTKAQRNALFAAEQLQKKEMLAKMEADVEAARKLRDEFIKTYSPKKITREYPIKEEEEEVEESEQSSSSNANRGTRQRYKTVKLWNGNRFVSYNLDENQVNAYVANIKNDLYAKYNERNPMLLDAINQLELPENATPEMKINALIERGNYYNLLSPSTQDENNNLFEAATGRRLRPTNEVERSSATPTTRYWDLVSNEEESDSGL